MKHIKHRLFLLVIVIGLIIYVFVYFLTSGECEKMPSGPYRQVTVYGRETVKPEDSDELSIEIESGEIDIYTHNNESVIFETAVRATGAGEKDEMEKSISKVPCIIECGEGKTSFEFPGVNNRKDTWSLSTDVVVCMPSQTKHVFIKIGSGKVTFHDDMKCDIVIEAGEAGICVNNIDGRLNVDGQEGNIRICSGKLEDGSQVRVGTGNVYVSVDEYREGAYFFETKKGNIVVSAFQDGGICFESSGIVKKNDFDLTDAPALVRLSSDIGEISITKK